MIDSSNYRYQNGSDVYISRIIKDLLSPADITSVAQAHRNMVETFVSDQSIKQINKRIASESTMLHGEVSYPYTSEKLKQSSVIKELRASLWELLDEI